MAERGEYVRLDGEAVTLVFAVVQGGTADVVYLGEKLPESEDLAAIAKATARGRHESQPDIPPVPGLLPEVKGGWGGMRAIELLDGGMAVETDFRLVEWTSAAGSLELTFSDAMLGIEIFQSWRLRSGDVVRVKNRITNTRQ